MTPPLSQPRCSASLWAAAAVLLASSVPKLHAQSTTDPQPSFAPASASAIGTPVATAPAGPVSPHNGRAAEDAYLAGARLLESNKLEAAEGKFARALQLDPTRAEYAAALTLAREHRLTDLVQQAGKARILGQTRRSDDLLAQARILDPQNDIIAQHALRSSVLADLNLPSLHIESNIPDADPTRPGGAPLFAGPIQLTPAAGTRTFHLHADTEAVVRQVLSGYNIRPTFDASVPHRSVRFDLEDTPYRQAVPILLSMTGLIAIPLDATSVLIAADTAENHLRFEHQIQETVYVPGSTTEQMGELGNIVRNVFDVKQAIVQNSSGNLIVRAPAETLNAVNLTLADLIDGGGQIVMDLRLYAIDKTRNRNIGPQIAQQFGVYNIASAAQNLVTANQTLVTQAIAQGVIPANASTIDIALYLLGSGLVQSSLLTNTLGFFGGGLTLSGLSSNTTNTFSLALNSSDTRALDAIQLRAGDRQSATFRAGTRYPITTSTFSTSGAASSTSLAGINVNGVSASSLLSQYLGTSAGVTVPQIQYEDLGITLKATPVIQKSGNISMHLDLRIESLAGTALNNIPILASRQIASDITVADGETALMLSSLTRTESLAVSGTPGLGELPGFQNLATDRNTERDTSELVLLVTPHVVRRRSPMGSGPRISFNPPVRSSD
jgi:general secretion pathway protein D